MMLKWLEKRNIKRRMCDNPEELIEKCAVYYIPCDRIRANSLRSRCDFNEDKLISLAYSIKHYGIIEPLCVRETDEDDSYDFELIAGERRLRAAKLAGISVVPCVIMRATQGISAEMSIIENIYAEPLDYFEVAVALQRIVELGDGSFEELASRLSIPQDDLLKKLWLLDLDYNERQSLLNMNVSEDVAVSIAKITDKDRRRQLIDDICARNIDEYSAKKYIEAFSRSELDSNVDIPRDVNSALKGIRSKLKLLNRHKKRAEMNFSRKEDTLLVEIKIEL